MKWPLVPLDEICRPKQWPTISQTQMTLAGYPVFGANGQIGWYDDYNHDRETVLITCRGATCGTINVCPPKSYVNGNAMALDDLDTRRVDTRFLVRALTPEILRKAITGSAQPQITRESLRSVSLRLPPLDEQRRIAAILDQADALRAKRRQVLTHLDTLAETYFDSLFGAAVESHNWDTRPLGDVAETRLGKMLDAKRRTGDHPRSYLRNANVQWFHFDLEDVFSMDFDERERVTFALRRGDVLMCEGGQPGRCAIWEDQLTDCYFQKAIHRIRLGEQLLPQYFVRAMKRTVDTGGLKDYVTSATIAHLTGEKLRTLPIRIPPLDLQRQFATNVEAISTQHGQAQHALKLMDHLFASLQSRAFRGEL
ncbi:restriction endonuclease subunit S [Rhodococcus sp. IEGM1428]|uniref:restriction endonuclease subunit S n=1 Tax=Rhodococcus sp. IEGM1428 TaxID=3392191 RepID=UPI003D14B3E4